MDSREYQAEGAPTDNTRTSLQDALPPGTSITMTEFAPHHKVVDMASVIRGQVVVLTGAAQGIGANYARFAAREGIKLDQAMHPLAMNSKGIRLASIIGIAKRTCRGRSLRMVPLTRTGAAP